MHILRDILANMDRISAMGDKARADARARGVSSFYSDDRYPGVIIEEKPDGSQVLTAAAGEPTGAHAAE